MPYQIFMECLKTFKSLLKKISVSKSDELYILGDFIDRGPQSKGVIDYIWELQKLGYIVHCLKGNHDQTFNPIAKRIE